MQDIPNRNTPTTLAEICHTLFLLFFMEQHLIQNPNIPKNERNREIKTNEKVRLNISSSWWSPFMEFSEEVSKKRWQYLEEVDECRSLMRSPISGHPFSSHV
jgi:hypothetical protein